MVNTFKELFTNGLEKFSGLKIEQDGLYTDTKTYKVLHLNFSKYTEEGDFKENLLDLLTDEFKRNGLDFDDQLTSPASLIEKVVSREENRSFVLLIDEYDNPLTLVLDNEHEFATRRSILRAFYCAIKDISDRFRFLFITGISRYSSMSIFSGLNILVDLSLDPCYGTLLGYTQEELECYFGDYIEFAACRLNQAANPEQQYCYESVLHLLKQHYDCYCFDELALTRVYNPWSILNFLNSPHVGFVNYWIRSGAAIPSILVKYLRQQVASGFVYEQFLDLNQTIDIETDSLVAYG